VLEWTPPLLQALSEADRRIGQLAGEGRRLPNPHLLIRPFVRREAVLSSRIEGTQATLGELLAAEAGVSVDRSPEDLREVGNYVVALEYGIPRLSELPLCVRLVRELHEKLMMGVRGGQAAPGRLRVIQNWIGRPGSTPATARFVPPPPEEVENCLAAWERFLHESELPPLVTAALMHYQFEAIHPFLDGNGRVGRLLVTLFLIERQILSSPLLYLSAFFEASRRDYYELLLAVSQRGAWSEWLLYFLNGVTLTSEDAIGRSARIVALLDEWHIKAASGKTNAALRLLDLLAKNPFVTVTGVAEKLGLAFTTAQRAIQRLEQIGVLHQQGDAQRGRVYCATRILEVLEEPARLNRWEAAPPAP
jgi:Fic family protein